MEDWRDITELCRTAANELDFKQPMINIPEFSLLESMSAVELMDPKMDQCFGISSSIEDKDLMVVRFPEEFSPKLLVGLLQSLIVQEMAYMDGASLLESTHQCILYWRESWDFLTPENLSVEADRLLRFCKASLENLGVMNQMLLDADVFEDEDFQPVSTPSVAKLDESENLTQVVEKCIFDLSNAADEESKSLLLIYKLRLKLNNLFQCLSKWVHSNMVGGSKVRKASGGVVQELPTELTEALQREFSTEARSAVHAVLDILREINAANSQETESGPKQNVSDYSSLPGVEFAFNPILVRIKQINPIRQIHLKPFFETIKHLISISTEILRVIDISDYWLTAAQDSLTAEGLLHATIDISGEKMHLIARSLYYSLVQVHSRGSMLPLLKRSLLSRGVPEQLFECDIVKDQWLEVVGKVVGDTLRAMTAHRNRLISRLDVVLNSWGMLSQEAGFVDARYCDLNNLTGDGQRPQWCNYWIMLIASMVMDVHLGLTVEMNLLSLSEFDYFYWYWDYICSTRLWALDKMRTMHYNDAMMSYHQQLSDRADRQAEDLLKLEDMAVASSGKGKKKSKKSKPSSELSSTVSLVQEPLPIEPPKPNLTCEELIIKARGQLCRGQFRMSVAASEVVDRMKREENPYTSWRWRFDQRFRAFNMIANPPSLNFEDFLKTLNTGRDDALVNTQLIVENARVCFDNAKTFLGVARKQFPTTAQDNTLSTAEASSRIACLPLTKVCVANSVTVMKSIKVLTAAQKCDGKLTVCPDFTHHLQYPAFELKLAD